MCSSRARFSCSINCSSFFGLTSSRAASASFLQSSQPVSDIGVSWKKYACLWTAVRLPKRDHTCFLGVNLGVKKRNPSQFTANRVIHTRRPGRLPVDGPVDARGLRSGTCPAPSSLLSLSCGFPIGIAAHERKLVCVLSRNSIERCSYQASNFPPGEKIKLNSEPIWHLPVACEYSKEAFRVELPTRQGSPLVN